MFLFSVNVSDRNVRMNAGISFVESTLTLRYFATSLMFSYAFVSAVFLVEVLSLIPFKTSKNMENNQESSFLQIFPMLNS